MAENKNLGELAKAYETILKAAGEAVMQAASDDKPVDVSAEGLKPKPREILFRGNVYIFKPVGPTTGQGRRTGVVERWQADIHLEDDAGFNVVVDEFYDGRYTPWAFDGIFFSDFMQAVIAGLVTGIYESRWQHEKWQHEKTRNRFMFLIIPAALVLALLAGILIGLRH